jgi:hypothetical protein
LLKERALWDDQKLDGLAKYWKTPRRDKCGNKLGRKDGGKSEETGDKSSSEFHK